MALLSDNIAPNASYPFCLIFILCCLRWPTNPAAYKDIRQVTAHQRELVDVLGSFTPKIVRMDGA